MNPILTVKEATKEINKSWAEEVQKEKAWQAAINSKTMDFDRVLELASLRALLLNHSDTQVNGGLLHIITEDGNYEDGDIDWCINNIESGEWKISHGELVSEVEASIQLDIAKQLRGLTEFEREMVNNGSTMNEDVFNFLFNGDPSGLMEE